jgi:hypothetical protein
MTDNAGIGQAIGTSTPNHKPRAARQPDAAERTQTGDAVAQSAVLGASAELPVSSGPISSEADNMSAHGSTPSETAADPQARNTPEAPLAARADSSVPPPIPAKDAAVIKSPTYTSLETSTSSPQTTNPAAS